MTKTTKIMTAAAVLFLLGWWFYPRTPLPLGYSGTAPNPENLPGVRPTVDCPVDEEFLKSVEIKVDGQAVNKSGFTLTRHKKVRITGYLNFQGVPDNADLLVAQISVASKFKNALGMMTEGETTLHAEAPSSGMSEFHLTVDQEWEVPNHAGEFNLLISFFLPIKGDRETSRRYALACPVKIE